MGFSGEKKVNAGSGVQAKTFVVDFATADEARWEALLEELKPIEVGVLGTSQLCSPLSLPLENNLRKFPRVCVDSQ